MSTLTAASPFIPTRCSLPQHDSHGPRGMQVSLQALFPVLARNETRSTPRKCSGTATRGGCTTTENSRQSDSDGAGEKLRCFPSTVLPCRRATLPPCACVGRKPRRPPGLFFAHGPARGRYAESIRKAAPESYNRPRAQGEDVQGRSTPFPAFEPRHAVQALLLAVAYFAAAKLSLLLAIPPGY